MCYIAVCQIWMSFMSQLTIHSSRSACTIIIATVSVSQSRYCSTRVCIVCDRNAWTATNFIYIVLCIFLARLGRADLGTKRGISRSKISPVTIWHSLHEQCISLLYNILTERYWKIEVSAVILRKYIILPYHCATGVTFLNIFCLLGINTQK